VSARRVHAPRCPAWRCRPRQRGAHSHLTHSGRIATGGNGFGLARNWYATTCGGPPGDS